MEKGGRASLAKKRRQFNSDTEDESILQECLNIIEYLFRFRLIEKIARPLDRRVRQEKIQEYGQRLHELHDKLNTIKNEIVEMNYNDSHHPKKSVFGEGTNKPSDWRKIIRNIQSKYNEVLVDGSYKYFRKVVTLLGLKSDSSKMEVISIEDWAAQCLDSRPSDACC